MVAKYAIIAGDTNDVVSLFVNPALGGPEPAALVSHTDATTADIPVGRVALRQGTTATSPNVIVDGIRVTNSWSSLATVVPVELTSFSAAQQNGNVTLRWNTASEKNNQGFDIERKLAENSWEKIGFMKGTGTTTEISSYSFVDKSVNANGKVYYRLKQTDFDGSYTYSKTVEVSLNKTFSYSLGKNYPNPFNPSTRISYSVPVKQQVTLKVFNLLGNEVATLVNEVKDAGSYNVDFNAKNLSSGIYYYRLQSGNFVQTNKMILIK